MTDDSMPNLYEYLGVAPDCPDSDLYAALDRAATLAPRPPRLSYAEDVLRNPKRRDYFNARHGLPSPQGRSRKGVPVPKDLERVPNPELTQDRLVIVEHHAPAEVAIQPSPVAGLLQAKWPLAILLSTGEVLKSPFPFVDIRHPEAVGRIYPDWVPPKVLALHETDVPGQELLALLFPLRADAQEPGSPEVWLRVIACSEAGGFDPTNANSVIRHFLSDTLAVDLVASYERLTKSNAKAQFGMYKCEGRYSVCGFIQINPMSSLRDVIEKALVASGWQSTVALFAATDQRYDYVIRELFMSL